MAILIGKRRITINNLHIVLDLSKYVKGLCTLSLCLKPLFLSSLKNWIQKKASGPNGLPKLHNENMVKAK